MSERNDLPPLPEVIVTFALPDESRLFVASLGGKRVLHQGRPPALPTYIGELGNAVVVVVHTGVGDTVEGRDRLKTMIAAAEDLQAVVSAGYAGGLAAGLQVGDLVLGENFSAPDLLARARQVLASESLHVGKIASLDAVAETIAAKAALAAETEALAVDMETDWIANVCGWAGVPLLSLRVISDAAGQDFPVPGHILFNTVRQRPRYLALPAWLLAHPRSIAPFAAFVRGLGPARERLTRALRVLVERL